MGRSERRSTALVDEGVVLGDGVVIWDFCRVRNGARIGSHTRLGTGVYVGAGVVVGERCKIENGALVFEGARLGDGVFIGPAAVLTNDRHPRAITPDGRLQGPGDWEERGITVDEGASVGAGAVIVAGVQLGPWSMVAAGAVVAQSVGPFELVAGVPARRLGWVCRCARRIEPPGRCPSCGRRYGVHDQTVIEEPS